jgi:hypothetical protein
LCAAAAVDGGGEEGGVRATAAAAAAAAAGATATLDVETVGTRVHDQATRAVVVSGWVPAVCPSGV